MAISINLIKQVIDDIDKRANSIIIKKSGRNSFRRVDEKERQGEDDRQGFSGHL